MGDRVRSATFERLVTRHGRTTADELGIDLTDDGPEARFQLLVFALLASARISADIATRAARALNDAGFTSARAMCDATWQQRVDALGEGGYVRYDESTATYLADTSELLLDRYDGDLERLRDAADRDPARERDLVRDCKGIGDVGVDILFRDLQTLWPELRPFVDDRAREVARELGLGDVDDLTRLHGDDDLAVVAAALTRCRLAGDEAVVRGEQDAPPTATQLAVATRDELADLGREHDVPGRSSMRRDELEASLREVVEADG